jgi:hypothetical protein
VVSGLPRSGTSMMMRMLEAGGVPPLTDAMRDADEDNPTGYYEFEPVKSLETDSTWIDDARGKSLKVVSERLRHLPVDRRYRVIFMVRKIEEVLASQQKMLERRGTASPDGPDDAKMEQILLRHIDDTVKWLEAQVNLQVLFVSFNQVFQKTREHVDRLIRFLGGDLDAEAMVAAVDPSLHRQKAPPG